MKIKNIATVFLITSFLISCAPTVTSMPTKIAVSIATFTPSLTPTKTPSPTFTSRPSNTPKPTAFSTPLPTKEVLLQYGIFGGDGGQRTDYYFGRDTPKLILYTDGQLLIQQEDDNGKWFMETNLSVHQMCSLLSQIENLGFFEEDFPSYEFDTTTQFGEGGAEYIIQVNGKKHRQINIYYEYVPFLAPKAKRIFNLFSNYSPPSQLIDYQAWVMLLWIEKGPGDSIYATPAPVIQTWPADLPPIGTLEKGRIELLARSDDFADHISQILVDGEFIKQISEVFGNRLAYKLFQTENGEYYIISRPLLPHEPLYDISPWLKGSKEFDLPFKCTN